MASKLQYPFESYGNLAGICQAESMDYSALWHLGNCNLTWESPKISTSQHQTPDKGIGTICAMCAKQEVLKKSTAKSKDWAKLTY